MLKDIQEYKIIGLDTETYLENRVMKPFLIQVYSEDFNPSLQEIFEVFREEEVERFVRWLISRNVRGSIIVTFNLGFDISVVSKVIKDPNIQIKTIEFGGKTIYASIKRYRNVTRILDLNRLLPVSSLAELGRMIGVEKRKRPILLGSKQSLELYISNEHYRNVMREYALQDARICYHAFKKLIQGITQYYEVNRIKHTIGGLSAYIYGVNYVTYDFPKYPNEVEAKIRASYRGGRTEVIKRGTNLEKVYYYDINSLYPYVMFVNRFPYNFNNGSGRFVKKSSVDLEFEGVAKALLSIEHEIPPVGVKRVLEDKFERLIFPEGKILGWFTFPELRYVEENNYGKIDKVYESFEYKVWCYPFKEYVKDLYGYRLKHREDKFLNKVFKFLMNSLYGKFGEYNTSKIVLLTNEGIREIKPEEVSKFRKYHNTIWASYITAYGRLELHRRFKQAGFKSVYYCDTDSLITSTQLPTGSELGELKLEGWADPYKAVFIRSKFYVFDDTIRLRGFTLSDSNVNIRELIAKGINYIEQERILKPLEALRRKKPLLTYEIYKKFFNVNTDYKRVYEKLLKGKELFETMAESYPRKFIEGGLDAINK